MGWTTIAVAALLAAFVAEAGGSPGWGLLVLAIGLGLALRKAHGRIAALESKLDALQAVAAATATGSVMRREAAPAAQPEVPTPPAVLAPPATTAGESAAPVPPRTADDTLPAEPPFLSDDEPVAAPAGPVFHEADERTPAVTSSLGRSLLAWFRGGNTIVRVGALILFIGVAFLLRFAAEHALLPIEWRLAGVALGGVALVAVGWRLRQRRSGYALSLQGAGIGVLYLVIFAALRLYALLPAPLAFALLAGLSAATALLAVAQNALALAVLGFGGGFLAPVLASTGQGSHVALFSYYLVLNAAIAWIASRQAWKLLNLVGFGFTFVIGTDWGLRSYEPSLYLSTQAFLAAHVALYLFISVQYSRQLLRAGDAARLRPVDGGLLFGLPIVAFGLQAGLVRHLPYGLAVSSAVLSAVYLLLGRWLWRHAGPALRVLTEGLLALGLIFLVLVTPLALDARWTGAAWAVQGAGVLWVALRQRRGWAAAIGLALQWLAALAFWEQARPQDLPAGLNAWLLGSLLLGGSALVSAWLLRAAASGDTRAWPDGPAVQPEWLRAGHALMLAVGVAQAGAGLWLEVRALDFPGLDEAWRASLLCVAAMLVIEHVQQRLRWPELGVAGRVLLAAAAWASASAVLDDLLMPSAAFRRFWPQAGVVEALAVLGGGVWLMRRLQRDGGPWRRSLGVEHLLLGGYAALQGALQLYALSSVTIERHTAWTALAPIVAPLLLAAWIGRQAVRDAWPFAAHPVAWQRGGLWTGAVLLASWSLIVNLLSDGAMDPLPTLPLLNPVDLGHLAIALLALRLWRAGLLPPKPTAFAASALGFVWVNALLVRTLHHALGTPMWIDGALNSGAVQTGLTILWTVLALLAMLYATRRAGPARARTVWLAGAVLLGVVVAKLFFVDLSSIGTLQRIVSFLGVGLLMLVIGYVSPMPPAAPATAKATA